MHLESRLLLIPYSNRWTHVPAARKAFVSAGLAVLATIHPGGLLSGVCAAILATRGAGITLHTWLELIAGPVLFSIAGAVAVAWNEDPNTAWMLPCRVFGMASATLLFAFTTPLPHVVAHLQRIAGLRTAAELIYLSYRSLTHVAESAERGYRALRLRGLGRGLKTAPKIYAAYAASLAIGSLRRAERAESGLAARRLRAVPRLLAPARTQ